MQHKTIIQRSTTEKHEETATQEVTREIPTPRGETQQSFHYGIKSTRHQVIYKPTSNVAKITNLQVPSQPSSIPRENASNSVHKGGLLQFSKSRIFPSASASDYATELSTIFQNKSLPLHMVPLLIISQSNMPQTSHLLP